MSWDTLNVLRLATISLADEEPAEKVPVYLFSQTPDNELSLIGKAFRLYREGRLSKVFICGGPTYRAPGGPDSPIAYSGERHWRKLLEMQIPREMIFSVAREPLSDTGTEAKSLVLHAKNEGWHNVIIVALPIQMPRAFANTVTQVMKNFPSLQVWAKPGLSKPYAETALFSQGLVRGNPLMQGLSAELNRLNSEWVNSHDIAKPDEIMDYVVHRGAR